mgnify:CR=1 FL=1
MTFLQAANVGLPLIFAGAAYVVHRAKPRKINLHARPYDPRGIPIYITPETKTGDENVQ